MVTVACHHRVENPKAQGLLGIILHPQATNNKSLPPLSSKTWCETMANLSAKLLGHRDISPPASCLKIEVQGCGWMRMRIKKKGGGQRMEWKGRQDGEDASEQRNRPASPRPLPMELAVLSLSKSLLEPRLERQQADMQHRQCDLFPTERGKQVDMMLGASSAVASPPAEREETAYWPFFGTAASRLGLGAILRACPICPFSPVPLCA
jgi:hypothetical protein